MSCINFHGLNNFTCSWKTDAWQFWGMKRSGLCFQRVIYQKFYSEDFGKNTERCVTWKLPELFPFTIENERWANDCVTSKLTVPYANYFVKSFGDSPTIKTSCLTWEVAYSTELQIKRLWKHRKDKWCKVLVKDTRKQCQYLTVCAPTPPLTQQQSTDSN